MPRSVYRRAHPCAQAVQRGRQQRRALAADQSRTAAAWMERQQLGSTATATDDVAAVAGGSGDGGSGTPAGESVPLESAGQRKSPRGILMVTSADAAAGTRTRTRTRTHTALS